MHNIAGIEFTGNDIEDFPPGSTPFVDFINTP